MSVVTLYGLKGRKLKADGAGVMADPRFYRGPTSHIFDTVKFANTDSIASKAYFGEIPSRAAILPQSQLKYGAFGAGVTLNIGDANDADNIASVIDVSAGGSADFLEAMTGENMVKPLWEILGYTADPDRMIDLVAAVAGAAVGTSTAWLTWSILFGRG